MSPRFSHSALRGAAFRAAREALGMTQAELAETLGLRQNEISRKEQWPDPVHGRPITRVQELALRGLLLEYGYTKSEIDALFAKR